MSEFYEPSSGSWVRKVVDQELAKPGAPREAASAEIRRQQDGGDASESPRPVLRECNNSQVLAASGLEASTPKGEAKFNREAYIAELDALGSEAKAGELTQAELEQRLRELAKRYGVRTATVRKDFQQRTGDDAKRAVRFEDPEPWPRKVMPVEVLDQVAGEFERYVAMRPEARDACALWATYTWLAGDLDINPLLVLVSPEKRCGKTTTLNLLAQLVRRPLPSANISAAALFRAVDQFKPTLLIDEADTFLGKNDEVRGIINAGHQRGSKVIRAEKDSREEFVVRSYDAFCPKAIAAIGRLPGTIEDRAIVVTLQRATAQESAKLERLRVAHPSPELADIPRMLCRFAQDFRNQIAEVLRQGPEIPEALNHREADNWEPLFAIADVAGGPWPERARKAALALSGSATWGVATREQLLADIRKVFEAHGKDKLCTSTLLEELCKDAEAPWATYNHGRPLDARALARLLRPLGILSKTIRVDGAGTAKGYALADFEEAFERYVPRQADVTGVVTDVTDGVTDEKRDFFKPGAGCDAVTDVTLKNGITRMPPEDDTQEV